MSGGIKKRTGTQATKSLVSTYDIFFFFFIKCLTRTSHVVVVQNYGKEMHKKSVLLVQNCFLLIFLQFSLSSLFSIARF